MRTSYFFNHPDKRTYDKDISYSRDKIVMAIYGLLGGRIVVSPKDESKSNKEDYVSDYPVDSGISKLHYPNPFKLFVSISYRIFGIQTSCDILFKVSSIE